MLDSAKRQHTADSSTAYMSSSSTRSLPIGQAAVVIDNGQYERNPLPHAQPANVVVDKGAGAPRKTHKLVRIAMLFPFHALNMCLGAALWVPSVLLSLASLPLWCSSDDSSASSLVTTATAFARLDIRLANFTISYQSSSQPLIQLSPRLASGSGPAVARAFTYFATLKLLTALLSLVACYGTFGTVLIAIISNGTVTGIPGVDTTFAEDPNKYVLYVLLRFAIGCLAVLRVAPRSVKATRFFCGLRDSEHESCAVV